MTTTLTIFPQYSPASGLSFKSDGPRAENNANAIKLIFSSEEYNSHVVNESEEFLINTAVILFYLSDTDADILANIGLLDEVHRKDLLPIIERMLDDMSLKAIKPKEAK